MSARDSLISRLQYRGGQEQQARMNEDKLHALKKALLYSYQAATAILADGREFRCLINPDKLKLSYDEKTISIPFKDIRLNREANEMQKTSEGEEEIGISEGDVFTWKENNTDWLVYLRHLEETAYFRAEIRKCNGEVEINGKQYKVYLRGPVETSIIWNKVRGITWNDMNYSLVMYITKDCHTLHYFHRFQKIKIKGKMWEVQVVDNVSSDGIITVALDETNQNTIEERIEKENYQKSEEPIDKKTAYIDGSRIVYPYDTRKYTIKNAEEGSWEVSTNKVKIIGQDDKEVTLEVATSYSGAFELKYIRENEEDIVASITIESL